MPLVDVVFFVEIVIVAINIVDGIIVTETLEVAVVKVLVVVVVVVIEIVVVTNSDRGIKII